MREEVEGWVRWVMEAAVRFSGLTGQGIEFAGDVLARACALSGLHVHVFRWFPTRVRGGYTYCDVRVSENPVHAAPDHIDLLVALSSEGLRSIEEVRGAVVLDEGVRAEGLPRRALRVPLSSAAEKAGALVNAVGLGLAAGFLGLNVEMVVRALGRRLKEGSALEANKRAVEEGFRLFSGIEVKPRRLRGRNRALPLARGVDLIALAALAAGCRFFAGYPITPATGILERLARWMRRVGGAVVQAEDELAAINMAIGASYAGLRAMTATSGPGLSLMAEGIGFAGMAETPIVVVDVQRAGPSTGLPTAHEQSDIDLASHPSHGDAPRIVLAPSNLLEYFTLTVEAFRLADHYLCPVILLAEQAPAMNPQTLEKLPSVEPADCSVVRGDEGGGLEVYPRYGERAVRVAPPMDGWLVVASSVEHDERGLGSQSHENHARMGLRRMGRLGELEERPVAWEVLGDGEAGEAVISVGSCSGAVEEAVARLRERGRRFLHIPLRQLWPIPKPLERTLRDVERVYVVEQNVSGQLLRLISGMIPRGVEVRGVRRFDGLPFRPGELVEAMSG